MKPVRQPADDAVVRSTVTFVDVDAPPAVEDRTPDYNAVLADERSEGGLTPRQLASHVLPSHRYVPATGDANTWGDAVQRVNDGISTKGHAAAKEAAGEWGHGTLQIVEGIEPTIVDGQQLGGDYFATNGPENPAGSYMSATPSVDASLQATGNDLSREAVQASRNAYQSFLDHATGRTT